MSINSLSLRPTWMNGSECLKSKNQGGTSQELKDFLEALRSFDQDAGRERAQNLMQALSTLFDKPLSLGEQKIGRLFLQNLSLKTVDVLLESFYRVSFQKETEIAPHWIVDSIDNSKLQQILKMKYEGVHTCSEWLHKCKEMLIKPEQEIKSMGEIRKIAYAIVRFITNLIDIFLIAFTLFDVGKDPQSAWEAQAMLDIYYKFFMIPPVIALLIKILMPLAELEVYLIASGVVIVLMLLITIYVRYLRPCPDSLPHCETNLTKDALEGKISPLFGRDSEVEELIHWLASKNGKNKQHILLLGESGVGKTEIVKEFARKVALGEVPEQLKGKKVFLVNTASLVQGGFFGYADQMKILLNRIRNLDQVILFFDEIHAALKNKSTLSDFLKPILDRSDLMCIAATTDKEFKEHIKGIPINGMEGDPGEKKDVQGDPAFLRRFHVIPVRSMKGKKLVELLNRHQQTTSPFIFAKKEVIEYLVKKVEEDDLFRDKAEPGFALSVMDLCIHSVAKFFDPAWESKALKKSTVKMISSKSLAAEDIDSIRPLKKERKTHAQISEDTLRVRTIFSRFKKIAEERRHLFASLYQKIEAALQKQGEMKEKLERALFLELEYRIPAMNDVLENIEETLLTLSQDVNEKLTPSVSKEMVDQVLEKLRKG